MDDPPSARPRPVAGGWGVWVAAMPSWAGGRKAEGGAEVPLLGSRSGSRVSGGGWGILWLSPPLRVLGCLVALVLALGSVRGALLRCSSKRCGSNTSCLFWQGALCSQGVMDTTAYYPLAVWQCTKGYHCLLPPCSVAVHQRIPLPTTPLQCGSAPKDTTAYYPLAVWQCTKGYHCLLPPCSVAVHQRISLPTTPLQCGSAPKDTTAYYPLAVWQCTKGYHYSLQCYVQAKGMALRPRWAPLWASMAQHTYHTHPTCPTATTHLCAPQPTPPLPPNRLL